MAKSVTRIFGPFARIDKPVTAVADPVPVPEAVPVPETVPVPELVPVLEPEGEPAVESESASGPVAEAESTDALDLEAALLADSPTAGASTVLTDASTEVEASIDTPAWVAPYSVTPPSDVTEFIPAPESFPSSPSGHAAVPPSVHATDSPPRPLATLEGRNITAWFGDHQVLDRVSLTMPAGQVTALIGPSGCGKSTFLRILNRMHELIPSASLAGEVLLDGEDIYDPVRKLVDARKHIGMVFQKPNPFPAMSIYDNVVAGLKLTGMRVPRSEKDELVESCLVKAGLWKEVKDRLRAPGAGLSGGQQQRLCIARSLAVTPKVLLMDEPCSALDPTSTRVIEETMIELQKEVTIVIVTHNMQQAQRVSQQCAFFLASQGTPGAIVEHGDTEAMFTDPIDPRTYDYVNGRFG